MTDTNERGFAPIGEKFLNKRDLFALKFNQGYVFLEVESNEFSRYEPYNDIEVSGVAGDPLPPGETTSFQTLEHSGDEILKLDGRGKQKVIHASIGQKPQNLRRYTNYPEASERMHQIDNLSAPRRGSEYGYVDGMDTPYHNPSEASELIIPPEVSLDFAFSNPGNKEKVPLLNMSIMTYSVNMIDPRDNREDARRIMSRGSPMPIFSVGTGQSQIDYELNWDVSPVTREEIMGGR